MLEFKVEKKKFLNIVKCFIGNTRNPLTIGPQPFEFKLDDGNCAADWHNWIRSFELFLRANEIKKTSLKRDWLLHYAGPKLQNVYFNLSNEDNKYVRRGPLAERYVPFKKDSYLEVINKLEKFFAPKKNQGYERHIFRKMNQNINERFDTFVMRLRIQANRCEFGNKIDENIRDQITSGCNSSLLRRKILEKDNILLDEIVKMAQIIEAVAEQQKVFGDKCSEENKSNMSSDVCKVHSYDKTAQFRKTNISNNINVNIECNRCGFKGHKSNYEKCPAKGKECTKCGKKDHFARKCFTRAVNKRKLNDELGNEIPHKIIRDAESVQMIENKDKIYENYEDIFMLSTPKCSNSIWCKIGTIEVQAVVDSGSKYNIIDRETWVELKNKNVVTTMRKKDVDIGFRAYGGHELKFLGMFEAILEVANKQILAKFYVANETGRVLLGLESAVELKIIKIDYNVNCIVNKINDKIGKIKDVVVEIPIKGNVKAVQQPYRRIPAPLEKVVEKKIDDLLGKDIIEKVNFSNWISPLVVVPKPDSLDGVRICVDMRRANEAVARENHPLPTIENFLPELGNATIFSKLDVREAFHQVD